jgi:hypothetical protein
VRYESVENRISVIGEENASAGYQPPAKPPAAQAASSSMSQSSAAQSAASSAASAYSYEKKVTKTKEVKEAAKTYSSSEETRMHPEQYNGNINKQKAGLILAVFYIYKKHTLRIANKIYSTQNRKKS